MNVLEKIDNYLNESWSEGQWIVQHRSSDDEYGILINQLKNGAWSTVTKIDGEPGKAIKKTTKGWYPSPVIINSKDVPKKVRDKVQQKLNQLNINLKV